MEIQTFTKIGRDDWSRDLYKGQETGRIYVEVDGVLHSITDEGEPCWPVIKISAITVVSPYKEHLNSASDRFETFAGQPYQASLLIATYGDPEALCPICRHARKHHRFQEEGLPGELSAGCFARILPASGDTKDADFCECGQGPDFAGIDEEFDQV